jgi:hypothetical protein
MQALALASCLRSGGAMRIVLFVLVAAAGVVACSSSKSPLVAATSCPPPDPGDGGDTTLDTPCSPLQAGDVCFVANDFSSCMSAFYRCSGGVWTYDHGIGSADGTLAGAACTGSPVSQCDFEGNPSCSAEPTAQSCQCGDDGLWQCFCYCYGADSDCGLCPEVFPGVGSNQLTCDAGTVCDYTGHSCTCTNGQFSCM